MGRNKNKDNRSASRKLNGHASSGYARKDSGLPSFFKQRKVNSTAVLNDPIKEVEVSKEMEMNSHSTINGLNRGSNNGNSGAMIAVGDEFLLSKASRDLSLLGKRDSSAKAFMKDVKSVIENSDVVLQVLDARDPLGCRSRQVEIMAMSTGKRVVLILNKVDLIPSENLQGWLKYLRNDFPTLAFKASTQQQRSNLKQGSTKLNFNISKAGEGAALTFGSEAIGASALLQLLKNYSRTSAKGSRLKQQLTVGVIGPPNVGKSSLINSLLRTRACAVASTPGWTKVIQGVMLEKGIRLLDCPGVIITGQEDGDNNLRGDEKLKGAWKALRNTIKVELLEDPITPVQALITRVEAEQLNKLYNIEGGFNKSDAQDFLLRVALLRGKLAKGGVPDVEGAARIVLHDWNVGRISYHTRVPAMHPSMKVSQSNIAQNVEQDDAMTPGASLLNNFGDSFDLGALWGEADAEALGQNNGGLADGAAALIKTRERRLLPVQSRAEDVDAIEADKEEEEEKRERTVMAEHSASLFTLGKRTRNQSDDNSDSDNNFESADTHFHSMKSTSDAAAVAAVAVADDDDDDDDDDNHEERRMQSRRNAQNEYRDRRLQKAESIPKRKRNLLTVFSEQELESMAERRGDVRKAAKKRKKRIQRSEAGLVDIWEKGLEFPREEEEWRKSSESRGLFYISTPKTQYQAIEGDEYKSATAAAAADEKEEEKEEEEEL